MDRLEQPETDLAPVRASVPAYLAKHYWWAYGRPRSVRLLDRQWIADLLLYGQYRRLREAALEALSEHLGGRVLQLACCYGDLTVHLAGAMACAGGLLDVVDSLPIQLDNLAAKLPAHTPAHLARMNVESLHFPDCSFDAAVAFMLLHEIPETAREATIREALRVLKPSGRLVLVDFGPPAAWHPLRYLWLPILGRAEPFAPALWRTSFAETVRRLAPERPWRERRYFGGLFRSLVG